MPNFHLLSFAMCYKASLKKRNKQTISNCMKYKQYIHKYKQQYKLTKVKYQSMKLYNNDRSC